MEKKIVVEISKLKKEFKIYKDKANTLKEKFIRIGKNKKEIREVLKSIDLSVKQGEVLGLIGENGSGKSTLLKLITRILYPTSGQIKIDGNVSSLLELGAGFHPDFTGIENIYFNASIFGLSKKEIDDRLNEIIEFSELGEFLYQPVRTYSSGMYMRLAFAIAINVGADIILIDEILAVGDERFQNKCFNKLEKLKKQGVTMIIVSHSSDRIKMICDRAAWIKDGIVYKIGEVESVVDSYIKYTEGDNIE